MVEARAGGVPANPGSAKEIPPGEHAYGEPPLNTAFLINETRQIVSVTSLDKLASFSWDAERLGQEIEYRNSLD